MFKKIHLTKVSAVSISFSKKRKRTLLIVSLINSCKNIVTCCDKLQILNFKIDHKNVETLFFRNFL